MLRDITLGQYYQTESVVHRLDPRVKLMATVIFIISLFVVNNFWGYLLAAGFLALVIRLSHVPFKFMVKGMKAEDALKLTNKEIASADPDRGIQSFSDAGRTADYVVEADYYKRGPDNGN